MNVENEDKNNFIKNKICFVRGLHVMLDSDLAKAYEVETKNLNKAVKRNIERFPSNFRFQLNENEFAEIKNNRKILRFTNGTLKNGSNDIRFNINDDNRGKHRKYLPYVFTEQGISMLSAVLRSETAVKVSIQIINAFVEMRKFTVSNAGIFQRLDKVEQKQLGADEKFEQIFKALEDKSIKPQQGIFYNGQIFDAYTFVTDLIRTAKRSIVLIDNYVDDTILTLLTKRKQIVTASIFTQKISKQLALDLQKHNAQYSPIEIKEFNNVHDRFVIIDEKTMYHFGASLKDLGKKWFAFSKLDLPIKDILDKLNY